MGCLVGWMVFLILQKKLSVSAVASVADSDYPFERLEGLILKHEDFHCEMNVLQVSSFPICKIKVTGSSHKNCPNQCNIAFSDDF